VEYLLTFIGGCDLQMKKISIVIVTYNSAAYIPQLFASITKQTVYDQVEVIIMDNGSADDTVKACREAAVAWDSPPRIEALGQNFGYAVSNNKGAELASGEFVFILNADTWLEPDCIEQMLRALEDSKAASAIPSHAELDSNKFVPAGPLGFDIFGRPTWSESDHDQPGLWHLCFMVGGAGFLIRREVWRKLGGFDARHFMYAEDDDISWKLWLAGYHSIYVCNAVMHHRTHDRGWEIKEFTRYLVNRNSLLVIFKNAQHILLLTGLLQVLMELAEGFLIWLISRSWKFAWNTYFKAVIDAFKMWPHVREMRRINRRIRRRSDWEMARLFLRFRINRWDMVKAFLKGRRPAVKPTP
jgi:hypothetical protein